MIYVNIDVNCYKAEDGEQVKIPSIDDIFVNNETQGVAAPIPP
jgi:hypothetical protein